MLNKKNVNKNVPQVLIAIILILTKRHLFIYLFTCVIWPVGDLHNSGDMHSGEMDLSGVEFEEALAAVSGLYLTSKKGIRFSITYVSYYIS